MNREELIKKWLDNELNLDEQRAFEALEDHQELARLSNAMQHFKAPEYNVSEGLSATLKKINVSKSANSNTWLKPLLRVAAVLVIAFGIYFYTAALDTSFTTLASQKTSIELPDESKVRLNAESAIAFNKRKWSHERSVDLAGEAYFIVAKGSKFDVNTLSGVVSVLGTEFNVKQRENLFEVICYEGSVQVDYKTDKTILKPGDSFLLLDGKIIAKEKEKALSPSWINNESYFKSMPFGYVINEFERQYNITINALAIDESFLFTGGFDHSDMELALKNITLPINLIYSIEGNTITLESE